MSDFVQQDETNGDDSLQDVSLPVATEVRTNVETNSHEDIPDEEKLAYENSTQHEQQQSTFLDADDPPKDQSESQGREQEQIKEQSTEGENDNEMDVDDDDILNTKNQSQFDNLFPKEKLLNGFNVGKQWFLTAAENSQLKLKQLQESEAMQQVNQKITQMRESETAQNISRRTSETYQSLKGSTQVYYDSVSASMGKFNEEAVKPTLTKVGETFSKVPENFSTFNNETLKPTLSKVGEGVQSAASGVVEVSKPIVTSSGEKIANLSKNIADTTSQGLHNASDWVKSRAGSTTNANGTSEENNTFKNSHTV